ncbi:MAG TPA: nuclear transport factor 2 family protein [Burkholderiaceae bacterium]|nr:nuclear transport factor 2 family protein [Burkholderiaceae bacterium]
MSTALETVQQIYAAFARGDIPAIVELLDDDVQWETWEANAAQAADVPWLRAGTGKAAAWRFFEEIARFRFDDFRVLGLMASDTQVAAEAVVDAVVPGGKRLRDEELHLWNVNAAGKVVRFRHYADTAKHIAAAR